MRIWAQLFLSLGFLASAAQGQKPPAPSPQPPPPPTTRSNPTTPFPADMQPGDPRGEMVLFLQGRVATDDGTPLPSDVIVERVCNANVRQQVFATTQGGFSMELGSMHDAYVDATGSGARDFAEAKREPGSGIPRRELNNCDLRASISGFRSDVVSLLEFSPVINTMDVGAIVVHRTTKVKGMTVNAAAYGAPKDAKKAYERGLEAERKGELADARIHFAKAVEIYPKYVNAWFHLGTMLQKDEQQEAARAAFTRATMIDSKYLPPYLSLAAMAYKAKDWNDVLSYTNHIQDQDPLKYSNVTGYILDLDPMDFAEAYFYNSAANYKLNRLEEAEKSGLRAERLDVRPRIPQLHLLLAEIFARKKKYETAISEIKMFLQLDPQGTVAEQARERLAELEQLNGSASNNEQFEHVLPRRNEPLFRVESDRLTRGLAANL